MIALTCLKDSGLTRYKEFAWKTSGQNGTSSSQYVELFSTTRQSNDHVGKSCQSDEVQKYGRQKKCRPKFPKALLQKECVYVDLKITILKPIDKQNGWWLSTTIIFTSMRIYWYIRDEKWMALDRSGIGNQSD